MITFRFKDEDLFDLVKMLSEKTYHTPHSFCRMAVIEYLKTTYPEEYNSFCKK